MTLFDVQGRRITESNEDIYAGIDQNSPNPFLSQLDMPEGIPDHIQEELQALYFRKARFGEKYLALPDIPNPGEVMYHFFNEIILAHQTFRNLKDRDKAALAILTNNRERMQKLGIPSDGSGYKLEFAKVIARETTIRNRIATLFRGLEKDETKIAANSGTIAEVASRIAQVDRVYLKKGKPSPDKYYEWGKARIGEFSSILLNFDGDLTLTSHADHLTSVPGSMMLEPLLRNGREVWFAIGFARYSAEALERLDSAFFKIGSSIELRKGEYDLFEEIGQGAGKKPIQPIILSANFEPIIRGIANRLKVMTPNLKVLAVTPNDIRSTRKGNKVLTLAANYPNSAQLIFADGETDGSMLNDYPASVGAAYFALSGGKFEQMLINKPVPYFPFRDGNDKMYHLKRLGVL